MSGVMAAPGIRGIDNRNPLNIKQGADPWAGSVGVDERGHAIFADVCYSVRALLRILFVYNRRYKLKTLRQMAERYAPASDTQGSLAGRPANQPNKYADYVARAIGKRADDDLDLFDADGHVQPRVQFGALVDGIKAVIEYECGAGVVYCRDDILRGVAVYHKLMR